MSPHPPPSPVTLSRVCVPLPTLVHRLREAEAILLTVCSCLAWGLAPRKPLVKFTR